MGYKIYVISRGVITPAHIPNDLSMIISCYTVIKRTTAGYRLKWDNYSDQHKGSMYLDKHYHFFQSEQAALSYLVRHTDNIVEELAFQKRKAERLMHQMQAILKANMEGE